MKKLETLLIIEGILLGIIGVLFFTNPIQSYFNFTTIAGIMLIVSGIFTLIRAFKSTDKSHYIFVGVINILFGLILWLFPISTTSSLIFVYGIWALVRGLYLFIISFKRKTFGFNANTLYNVCLIILGILIFVNPIQILLYTPFIIGTYFIISAIFEIYLGFNL
ncbi:HdeD family acid-resistance protein [Romboutsia sp. 1001713B170131_170501_G6]|uniref:HdeD family acid-resistance protein n=1 Tax=Romboutsia sp. 1001713B170131_170501_G6 TaxID=2787108 RepID=UPI0018AC0CE6|nr:DUF308 domain-containing protein [Romboutsia sp. 1001713B170131_170501_G6]